MNTSIGGYRRGDKIIKSCLLMMMMATAAVTTSAAATTSTLGKPLMNGLKTKTRLSKKKPAQDGFKKPRNRLKRLKMAHNGSKLEVAAVQ